VAQAQNLGIRTGSFGNPGARRLLGNKVSTWSPCLFCACSCFCLAVRGGVGRSGGRGFSRLRNEPPSPSSEARSSKTPRFFRMPGCSIRVQTGLTAPLRPPNHPGLWARFDLVPLFLVLPRAQSLQMRDSSRYPTVGSP
jgi:hypothetical protein